MSPLIPGPGKPVGINPDWHLERPPTANRELLTVSLPDVDSTRAFGRDRLAPVLMAGDLVIVSGPLGAGKTALVQGIGAGLQVEGPVLSPTFVIARVHGDGRLPLVHVDAYRLDSMVEIDDLDLDTDLSRSVTVVEWGTGLAEQLADEHLVIELSLANSGHSAGSLPNRPLDEDSAVGSLPNGRSSEDEAADDVPRIARLMAYGAGWQSRVEALRKKVQ